MKKKIFAVLALAILLALSIAPAAWAATVASGECGVQGDNVTWVLDATGTLTISGTGAMKNYGDKLGENYEDIPWYSLRENIKSVVIENGITNIGDSSFNNCTNLMSIDISNSVANIGHHTFYACDNLVTINLPNSIQSIGWRTFEGCNKLESITLPNSIKKIALGLFEDCSSLTNITIPSSVTVIESSAFSGCNSLTNVTIPNGVTRIFNHAFYQCSSLTNINIPDSVTMIDYGTFSGCTNLVSIKLPNALTSISEYVFYGCSSLNSINIPDNVESIGHKAFQYCNSLTSITIPDSVHSIGDEAFDGCYNLMNITIPDSINFIGYTAFGGCSSLNSVTIPDGIVSIEHSTFNNCSSLTTITIPNSILSIEDFAFQSCDKLTNVYYAGTKADWVKIAISDEDNGNEDLINAIIHCSDGDINIKPSQPVPVTAITMNQTVLNLEVGGTATLTATVAPANATNKSVRWSSNNTSVATVDANGKVTTLAAGTATITVTTEDGKKTASCTVTVTEKKIPVTGITLNKTALTMEVKNTEQLKAIVLPADTTSKIAWTSSNEKVATVDETGKITPLTKGTATITAAADGIKASCNVTVTADKVYTITFDTDGGTLAEGITNPDYVIKGETYKMPTATKSRYTLTAWAIGDKDSENKVKANDVYTFTADTTVYAIWQYNGGGGGGSSRPSGGATKPTKPTNPEKPGNNGNTGNTGSNTVTAANINNKFADVQNNAWYSEAIAYVYNKGMMNGTEKGFEPNASTTRAMLVTMLHRLENEPVAAAAKFSDVASGQWFSNAVSWAAANGVVNGYENGTFAPNASITREQLAAVLYRYAQLKGYNVTVKGDLSGFSDSANVSGWAQDAVQWAVGVGIINGDGGALKPAGNATRAEVAMMLMRYIENVAK